MNPVSRDAVAGAMHLLSEAGTARRTDKVLLILDDNTREIAENFEIAANELGLLLTKASMPIGKNHGEEPTRDVATQMKSSSLVVALTTFSLAHSNARQEASASGTRFLSLPQYSASLLAHTMVKVDYRALSSRVKRVSDAFTIGNVVHITSAAGTDLTISIAGRSGNYCPAFVENPGDLGSPPDIEANVSPVETGANGIAVVDGSITHPSIGLLENIVEIEFVEGIAINFSTSDQKVEEKLSVLFQNESPKRRVLAEVGIGLNPFAELTGAMLSDEGTLGTAHLGLGSNFYVGGKNLVDFHLDFVLRDVSLTVDEVEILKFGKFSLDVQDGKRK